MGSLKSFKLDREPVTEITRSAKAWAAQLERDSKMDWDGDILEVGLLSRAIKSCSLELDNRA